MPRDLKEVFSYLDAHWTVLHRSRFKFEDESRAVNSEHFETGLFIRNTWIRGNRNPQLVRYFADLGLHVPDDISSVILSTYHRYLNKKPLGLNERVAYYKKYWDEITKCEKSARQKAIENYNEFKVGDSLMVLMEVDTAGQHRNAVKRGCCPGCRPNNWKFDPNIDLMVKGVLVEKYNINAADNVFFTVRLMKMNYPNTMIMLDSVGIGSNVKFSLPHLLIRKVNTKDKL